VQFVISLYFVMKMIVGPPLHVLVDSRHELPVWYEPGESVVARQALDELIRAAEMEGLKAALFSGYRDYDYQAQVYKRERRNWPERVDEIIANPGHSEHQLGTAFDIAWPGLPVQSLDERNLRLFNWVQAHAHHYGFVVSYPLKTYEEWPFSNRWKAIETDFIYEPWHIRYVGVDLATDIFNAGYLDPESDVFPSDFYVVWP
jgi:D-alanyl-D-alanine carboxypeptidase